MKKIVSALTLAALAAISIPAQADMTTRAFQQLSTGNTTDRFGAEAYVGGVVKGYLNANGFLSARKQPLLFCYSGDYTSEESLAMTKQVVKTFSATHPGTDESVEVLLLVALVKKHPCA